MYPPSYSHERQPSTEKIQGAGAQMAVETLWLKTVLRVYFKNPQYLMDTTGCNTINVMTWAKIWGRDKNKAIPTFTEEQDVKEADIRVEFVCESLLLSNYYASVCKIILINHKFKDLKITHPVHVCLCYWLVRGVACVTT